MTEQALPLTTFYSGWDGFRQSLVKVVAPLTGEQLVLPTALHHWSIGLVVQHILANRVWWFHKWMGAGNPDLAPIADWGWGEEGHEVGTAAELVVKLEATSQMIQEALAGWTPANLANMIPQPAWLSVEERKCSLHARGSGSSGMCSNTKFFTAASFLWPWVRMV